MRSEKGESHSTEKDMNCEELEAPREGTDVPWGGDQTPGDSTGWGGGKGGVEKSEHTSSRSLCAHMF